MNGTEFLRRQVERNRDRRLVFHERAVEFLDLYDVDESLIEGVVRRPQSVRDDPHAAEVGYPIKRYRRGDVEVVVGYQFPAEPAVLYVHLHLPIDNSRGAHGGGNGPQGGRAAPKTLAELEARVRAAGYTLTRNGGHTRVLRANGSLLMLMPCTPGSVRTLSKTWARFVRLHATDSLDTAR